MYVLKQRWQGWRCKGKQLLAGAVLSAVRQCSRSLASIAHFRSLLKHAAFSRGAKRERCQAAWEHHRQECATGGSQ